MLGVNDGSLRVLVDATAIPADRGGVGRYVDDLLPALARQGVELVVACQARDVEVMRGLVPDAAVAAGPAPIERRAARMVWEQVGLPRLARQYRADVVHSPHYTFPLVGPASVVTLHDATFFSHPDLHSRVKRVFFRAATRRAVRRADALVVPSRATRDAVLAAAGGDPEAFHVAYHGVDTTTFHPVADEERRRVKARLGLTGEYVAFLGTLEPRKNVPALVRAWARVAAASPDPPALVLAGGRGWDKDIDSAVAAVPEGLHVVRPGYLPLADLAPFLSGAQVVAYPSLGEGFGLPVLEAMACGAAVLTTRELSLPEVGGEAVAYCDTDEGSIARALAQLLADASARQRLALAACARAAMFTWDTAAQRHVAAYRAAVRRHASRRGGLRR